MIPKDIKLSKQSLPIKVKLSDLRLILNKREIEELKK